MKRLSPVAVYTSSRLLLFIVTASILALVGLHGVGLLLIALIVSGLLSYVLLSKQRDAMSAAVVARTQRAGSGQPEQEPGLAGRLFGGFRSLGSRIDERARAEDDADEAAREAPDPPAS